MAPEPGASRPTYASYRGGTGGSFTPPSPGGPPAPPAPPPPPTGPPRTSGVAIAAFVVALAPVPFWALAGVVQEDFAGIAFTVSFLAGVVATILGGIGLSDTGKPNVKGRGYAIAGLTLGIIEVVGTLIAVILLILLVAALFAACASCGSATVVAGSTRAVSAPPPPRGWTQWTAHHPPCGHYAADTYGLLGARWCVGCFTAAPVLVALWLLLEWLQPGGAWWAWFLAGPLLGLPQAWSVLGRTRTRASKILVKAFFGAGCAVGLYGLSGSPWPLAAQALFLVLLGTLGVWMARPRARRIAGGCTRHASSSPAS